MVAEAGSDTRIHHGVFEQGSTPPQELSYVQRLEKDDISMEIIYSSRQKQTRWCSTNDIRRNCSRDGFRACSK